MSNIMLNCMVVYCFNRCHSGMPFTRAEKPLGPKDSLFIADASLDQQRHPGSGSAAVGSLRPQNFYTWS
jgi:hypothetical protein